MSNELPLYREIRRAIVDRLMSGIWRPGDQLPPEPILAEDFRASIGTVRKAVDVLVEENVLRRHQGRGTFVVRFTPEQMYDRFFHVVDAKGKTVKPETKLIAFENQPASKVVAEGLGIDVGTTVAEISNLRTLHGEPLIVDVIYPNPILTKGLAEEDFISRRATIYGLYQDQFGLTIIRTDEMINAVRADRETARLLGLSIGDPALLVRRTGFTFDGSAVEYRHRYLRSERHAYRTSTGMDFS